MIPAETAQRLAEAIWWDQLADMTVEELDELGRWLAAVEGLPLTDQGQEIPEHGGTSGAPVSAERTYPSRRRDGYRT